MKHNNSRRDFIRTGVTFGLGLPILWSNLSSCDSKPKDNTSNNAKPKSLDILILGGTSFLGLHQVAYALDRGHKVSIFTRGKTKPSLFKDKFKQVEQLIGDRNDNLTALENRSWDVVIDNSGHNAEWTKQSAKLLKVNCDLYLYTSSTGVYYPYLGSDIKEDTELVLNMPEGITDRYETIEYEYGIMKANSEREAINQFGADRTIIVRPTYMFGPADKTNRFIHWPIRLSKGGEVLVPGKENDRVQYIDVRDVAEWMIRLLEDKNAGTFNAVGPKGDQTIYEFVEEAQQAFTADNTFIIVDDYEFLMQHDIYGIVPWILPTGNNSGSAKINNEKGLANGLQLRPLVESIKDTYNWWTSDAVPQSQRDMVELDPNAILVREDTILKSWKTLTEA
ncbi:MAG: NAD-dependent epimerase/dehydratase family protein [Winogradskyella sp.]|nr:NAD-dependent epimerase/dehydratase family protein [Winogradskyella sp.]